MQSTQPVPQPATATPQPVGAAGVVGTSLLYARQDHVHAGIANAVSFQNAADNGKQFQRVLSGTITCGNTQSNIFASSATAVSFASTFATTPVVQGTAVSNPAGGVFWALLLLSVTTTGVNAFGGGSAVNTTGTIEIWGLG